MSEQAVTPEEWVQWFTFAHPEWTSRIGDSNKANIPDFLEAVRDTGHFNMMSAEVAWLLSSAFVLTQEEAKEHLLMWIRSFK